MYLALKHAHMTLVVISVSLFVLRFIWTQRQSPMMQQKWVKVVPHIIDTFLLSTALGLCFILSQYPFVTPWLTDKVIGLMAYIILGMVALKLGRTQFIRWVAFLGALSWIIFLAKVAVTKQPILLGY